MARFNSQQPRPRILPAFAGVLALELILSQLLVAAPRVESFDADWRFFLGDTPAAEEVDFDDSAWRRLDVPHDWSIELPFDRDAPTGRGGAYLPAGVGWYRKHFALPAEDSDARVFIEFDGVMSHSDVSLNGTHIGQRPSGYASFRYDVTKQAKFGGDNILALRVDNSRQPASRWHAGAGIYRHVRLVVADSLRLQQNGVFITTPHVAADAATVRITANVINGRKTSAPAAMKVELWTPGRELVASGDASVPAVAAGATATLTLDLELEDPRLWSPQNPSLYVPAVQLHVGGGAVESRRVPFGVREFRFEPDTGFWLNGENMKLKGVCLHHDGGAVGAAVPKDVWRRRLERLKSLGVNAIRTAHNPFAPEFLDLCDELGFLVMHEVFDCWTVGKNNAQNGYNRDFAEWWERDLRDAVLRDRNHPSIILYSAGNEIRDNLRSPAGFEQFQKMKAIYDELDGTRPVTMAIFRPNQSGVYTSGFAELMDVIGQNYREAELVRAHRDKPLRKILGTENGHDRNVWLMMRDNPAFSGEFLWTGIDYLGESDWPYTTWGDALVDRMGFVKPAGLERQSWWTDQPMVAVVRSEAASGGASGRGATELVDHWTPRDPDTYDEATAFVYSNCEEVELVLNGESLGRRKMPDNAAPAEFKFPFDPGECVAIGYRHGEPAARQTLKTAGPPAAIKLSADRKQASVGFDHVAHVEFEIVDASGERCPWSDAEVTFEVKGPAKLIAVDNGDPQSHESFQGPARRAFHGRGLAIVRRIAGDQDALATVTATSPGLESASVDFALRDGSGF